jgi:hypothetical protein
MTNEEKRMNKMDLNNFKTNNDPGHFEALIPGIHNLNTVGTSPLKRGGRQILSNPRLSTSLMPNKNDSNLLSQSMKNLPPFENALKNELAMKKEMQIDSDRYNPITNPIPWLN